MFVEIDIMSPYTLVPSAMFDSVIEAMQRSFSGLVCGDHEGAGVTTGCYFDTQCDQIPLQDICFFFTLFGPDSSYEYILDLQSRFVKGSLVGENDS